MSVHAIPRPAERTAWPAASVPSLAGIGVALPEHRWLQRDLAELQADLWSLEGAELERWRRIVDRSGIEPRAIVGDPTELPALSTAAPG